MKKILILLIVTFCQPYLYGQITLVNPEPDFTTTVQSPPVSAMNLFPIDLNNDGTPEYTIRWDDYGGAVWFLHVSANWSQGNNANFVRRAGDYLEPLEYGDQINTANTTAGIAEPFIADIFDTNFQGLGNRYIGFRSVVSGVTRYGWILVTLVNRTLTIKEYAYTTNASGLFAGQGGTLGIDEQKMNDVCTIFPNPTSATITVSLSNSVASILEYTVFDLTGKLLHSGNCMSGDTIDVGGISAGNYILKLYNPQTGITLAKKFTKVNP